MSVNIEIKQKGLFKKYITVEEIAQLMNLQYGVSDNNYTLDIGKIGQYTILYDQKCIGRGIEVSFEEKNVILKLSLPTIPSEIKLFYNLVEKICKKLNVKEFYRDEEIVKLENCYAFIENDNNATFNAIKDIENKIKSEEYHQFYIFGALNPISIGKNEINKINNNLDNFEKLINRLQQQDVFYANPKFYKRESGTIFGMYFVGPEIDTVVPTEPYVLYNVAEKIDDYYVMIPGNNCVKYNDFIKNVRKIAAYDNNHFIVSLKEDEILYLISNYTVDTTTNEKKAGNYYFGKTLDYGYNHSKKVKEMDLNIEELSGYNHLAVFIRWSFEHDLLSEQILNIVPELPNIIKDKNIDLREVVRDNQCFKGEIKIGFFNDIGKAFANTYYVFNSKGYPSCVDLYAEQYFGTEKYNSEEFKNEAYLFVPYNEEYYQGLSKFIDKAWEDFKNEDKESKNGKMYLYSEKDLEDYEKFIKNNWGEYYEVFHEILSPDIHLDVIIVPPTESNNYYKLITMGMGAYKMNVPENLKQYELERAELVIYLPPTWNIKSNREEYYWAIRQLKSLARLPLQCNTWFGFGHTISSDEKDTPYAKNTDFCSMMLLDAKNNSGEKLDLRLEDAGKINFYQLFPLYKEELETKLNSDAETLLKLFNKEDLQSIVNIDRKNYCSNKIKPKEEIVVDKKAVERREKSNTKIKNMGIACLENLPTREDAQGQKLKSLDVICKRAIACLLSTQIACDINENGNYEESKELFTKLLKEFSVEEYLNDKEKRIFNGEYTPQDAIDVTWTYEAYWSLVWVLGLIEDISLPSNICDCEKAIKLVGDNKNFDEFKSKCKLRDVNEILDMLDLYYRYHWACEEKRINPNTDIGNLNPDVVIERRRGLEWLFAIEDDWFKILLDT